LEFERITFESETAVMSALFQWVQNGLIDHQTAIETMDFYFPQIKDRMDKIKKLQKDGKGIFLPTPSANNLGPGAQQKGGLPSGPRGGKPKSAGGAKNNKTRVNKPKKAVAKLLEGADGLACLVVKATEGMEVLDAEDRELISEKFGLPADHVLTEGEFKIQAGASVDWMPKLPELTTGEVMAAMKKGQLMVARANDLIEEGTQEYQEAHKGEGKRGAYVTAKVKGEIAAGAHKDVLVKQARSWPPPAPAYQDGVHGVGAIPWSASMEILPIVTIAIIKQEDSDQGVGKVPRVGRQADV
jgi:hypothetical protein